MGDRDRPTRDDIESGLRFIHQMEIEGRLEQTQAVADVAAIKALLIERGVLAAEDIEARRAEILDEQAQLRASRRFPSFGDPGDKYAIETPDIPCDELVDLCLAACCNLEFSLSIQDLEEGVIRWRYGEPYLIAQDPVTTRCVHYDGGGCAEYERRPGPCRAFDCRSDPRIWKDYEERIPADGISTLAGLLAIPDK